MSEGQQSEGIQWMGVLLLAISVGSLVLLSPESSYKMGIVGGSAVAGLSMMFRPEMYK